MKNRIGNRIKGLGMTAFLLLGTMFGSWGQLSCVRAEGVDNPEITIKQEASWTDRENHRAQLTIEVSGLKNDKEGQAAAAQTDFFDSEESVYVQGVDFAQEISEDEMTLQETWEMQLQTEAGVSSEMQEHPEMQESPETQGQPEAQEPSEVQETPGAQEPPEIQEAPGTQEPSEVQESPGIQALSEVRKLPGTLQQEGIQTQSEENAGQASERNMQLWLINYISEYFEPDVRELPAGCTWETISVNSRKGSQTTITKIMYDMSQAAGSTLSLVIPVTLRQEYRVSALAASYPLSQDAPLSKDCTASSGTFLQQNPAGGNNQALIVAESSSPELEVPASKGDYSIDLKCITDTPKAGQNLVYEINVENTGQLPLKEIRLEAAFSREGLSAQWEPGQGIEAAGNTAVIAALDAEESKTLKLQALIPEEQDGDITCTINSAVENPGNAQETMNREQSAATYVNPLKIDFTVEKTTNRTTAMPGDTITYQICIRNTGERTLHSVVGTERLLGAGVQAEFVARTGVTLNSTRTQALIPQISPGEAFALEAVVTLPLNFTSRELINQVTVVTKETGGRTVQSQANIAVQALAATASPTPVITGQGYYQSGLGTKSGGSSAYSPSGYPKTGDTSETGLFTAFLLGSFLSAAGAFWHMKAKRKH